MNQIKSFTRDTPERLSNAINDFISKNAIKDASIQIFNASYHDSSHFRWAEWVAFLTFDLTESQDKALAVEVQNVVIVPDTYAGYVEKRMNEKFNTS